MALDMSKGRGERLLGRGRVPQEVRDRIAGKQDAPDDPSISQIRAKSRRLIKEGKSLDKELRKSLREMGGPWERPEIWNPPFPSKRAEWTSYQEKLDYEHSLAEPDRRLFVALERQLTLAGFHASEVRSLRVERSQVDSSVMFSMHTINGRKMACKVTQEVIVRLPSPELLVQELATKFKALRDSGVECVDCDG